MRLLVQVVRWEVGRHLRNKQFLAGLFITPLIFALFGAVPSLLTRFDKPQEFHYLVADQLGALPGLQEQLAGSGVTLEPHAHDEDLLREKVLAGEVDGYFMLDPAFIETGTVTIYTKSLQRRPSALEGAIAQLLQQTRLEQRDVDRELLAYVSARPILISTTLEVKGENTVGNMPMAIGFSVLLFFLIMGSGSMLLMSALQEKRDRMSEVVLSSVDADTLMAGKIVGHFFLGVFQIAFWLAIGLPVAYFLLDVPLGDYITPSLLPIYGLFTLLGYLLFAALFVGMGATMENMESASNSQGMVFMLPALSFFVVGPIVGNPDGIIARIATIFPITSPTTTILRSGLTTLETWEWVVAALVLLLTTGLVVKVASKIFRVGMLMYGKNPNLKELWKWLRHA